jgi:Tfp pilus assembly protein PilN
MRAVNLIPADELRAGRGGHSGGAAYALLAALAVLVAMAAGWSHLGRSAADKKAEVASVSAQADVAEARAGELKSFSAFESLRDNRTATVRNVVAGRFDWPHALREVARTMPSRAWATSLRATVSPNVSVEGTADPLRSALPLPAIELSGCAMSQRDVAATISAMRRIDGVQRVSLSSSGSAGAGSTDACGDGTATAAAPFSMTVFFHAPAGAPATTTAPAGAAAATAPAAGTTTGSTK